VSTAPKAARGFNMSLMQIFGQGPKWTVTCGKCEGTFQKRLPMVADPGVACPYCGEINVLQGLTISKE